MKRTGAFLIVLSLLICVQNAKGEGKMEIFSPAFEHKGEIPSEYTCQGKDINPQLNVTNIPKGTQSLVLIVDDPDAPSGTWVHWVVYNIKPTYTIKKNSVPGRQLGNDFGRKSYGGPCPPSGRHRYFFKLYALDTDLRLSIFATQQQLEVAMRGHILDQAQLIGLYQKK